MANDADFLHDIVGIISHLKFSNAPNDLKAFIADCEELKSRRAPESTKYFKGVTPNLLIQFLRQNGIMVDQDNLNLLADILGNNNVLYMEDLYKLDPDTTLRLMGHVWGTKRTIEYYNRNFNPDYANHDAEIDKKQAQIKEQVKQLGEYKTNLEIAKSDLHKLAETTAEQLYRIEALKLEVVQLKANLYDLMILKGVS